MHTFVYSFSLLVRKKIFPIENSTTVDERRTGKLKKNIIKENVHVLILNKSG